jgi:hypothetical protein
MLLSYRQFGLQAGLKPATSGDFTRQNSANSLFLELGSCVVFLFFEPLD